MRLIIPHLGLGDLIAFADLITKLAGGKHAVVPCWEHNEISAKSIFVNHKNIHVVPMTSTMELDQLANETPFRIGMGHYSDCPRMDGEDMIEWVYRSVNMDPAERFEDGVVEKAAERVAQRDIEAVLNHTKASMHFVHNDRNRGFIIDPRKHGPAWWEGPYLPVNDGRSILSYCDLMKELPFIHCIDSAFLHLAEQLPLQDHQQLFYHKYARPGSEGYNTLRHPWKVLE